MKGRRRGKGGEGGEEGEMRGGGRGGGEDVGVGKGGGRGETYQRFDVIDIISCRVYIEHLCQKCSPSSC